MKQGRGSLIDTKYFRHAQNFKSYLRRNACSKNRAEHEQNWNFSPLQFCLVFLQYSSKYIFTGRILGVRQCPESSSHNSDTAVARSFQLGGLPVRLSLPEDSINERSKTSYHSKRYSQTCLTANTLVICTSLRLIQDVRWKQVPSEFVLKDGHINTRQY